jgi:hypothetical protein
MEEDDGALIIGIISDAFNWRHCGVLARSRPQGKLKVW